MLDVIRTIHPIGQGGFVSEYLPCSDHLVVYDCGTSTKLDKKYVYSIFDSLPKRGIDILFISHFDEDHVSLIPELKKRRHIRRVVVPLMNDVAKALLFCLAKDSQVREMIYDPASYFPESRVTQVKQFLEGESASQFINEEDLGSSIKSNTPIKCNVRGGEECGWEYIPFNFEQSARQSLFVQECKSKHIDVDRLGDVDYVSGKTDEIRNAYKSLRRHKQGTINQNSMLLYSGALAPADLTTIKWRNVSIPPPQGFEPCFGRGMVHISETACLYTGDCDWSTVHVFHDYLGEKRQKHIGLLQTPHHGSKGSYNRAAHEFLTSLEVDCFVQFGSKNNHGHPCMKVMCASRQAFMVTEKGVGIYPANW